MYTKLLKELKKYEKTSLPNLVPIIIIRTQSLKEVDETLIPSDATKTLKTITSYYHSQTNKYYYGISQIEAEYGKDYVLYTHKEMPYNLLYCEYIDDLKGIMFYWLNTYYYPKEKYGIAGKYFLDKNKRLFSCHNIKGKSTWDIASFHASYQFKIICANAQDATSLKKMGLSDYTRNEFHKAFGPMHLDVNTYSYLDSFEQIKKFINSKNPKKSNSKNQKSMDEYLAYKLDDIDISKISLPKKDVTNSITKIEKVTENLSVIRWFFVNYNKTLIHEGARLYVGKNSCMFARKNDNDEFVYIKHNLKLTHFMSDILLPFNKEDVSGTMLQYFGDVIDEIRPEYKTCFLWLFLSYPEAEKLYKIGMNEILTKIFNEAIEHNTGKKIDNIFKEYFSIDITQKSKNIYTFVGLNKYQINKFNDYAKKPNSQMYIIHVMKQLLSLDETKNISSIDNDQFDIVFNAIKDYFDFLSNEHNEYYWWVRNDNYLYILQQIKETYSIKTLINQVKDKNFYDVIMNGYVEKEYYGRIFTESVSYIYRDYLNMVKMINDTVNFKAKFETAEDIVKMHDAVTLVYNIKKEEYKTTAFKKIVSKFEKFEFNDDENFCVIAPQEPGEIAAEGITLHHCVKSYIDRVIAGSTNILFIRKVTEPTKPFFTVEVSNSGNIEQVHGFANRNADTEEGMVEFVKKWAKAKKLKCNNFNKVR